MNDHVEIVTLPIQQKMILTSIASKRIANPCFSLQTHREVERKVTK